MKRIQFLFLSVLITGTVFSQTKGNNMNVADSGKTFQWEIQAKASGNLMLLDVPYKRDGQDSSEDMTITVAKERAHKRPASITVIVPNNVQQANGIYLKFSKSYEDVDGKWSIQMDKSDPVRIQFEKCNDEQKICIAKLPGGYMVNSQTDEKVDIFQRFMEFDHVYFLLVYPDGKHKSIPVALSSFKDQYKALAEADAPVFGR